MAEKIVKTYTVAGKTFTTYPEALAHRKVAATDSIRNQVGNVLWNQVCWEGWTGDSDEILDALFQHFDIKPKKAAQ